MYAASIIFIGPNFDDLKLLPVRVMVLLPRFIDQGIDRGPSMKTTFFHPGTQLHIVI